MPGKPKVLYIRPAIKNNQRELFQNIFTYREKALQYYFELFIAESRKDALEILEENKDIDLICLNIHDEQQEILFSPSDFPASVPRVALLSFDAVSPSLPALVNYFERLKVDAYFAFDTSMGEYAEEIRHKLYYWNWSINEDNFRDYQLTKDIEILLTSGNFANGYHWRKKVFPILAKKFDCVFLDHFTKSNNGKSGSEFSKVLNRSKIVPTCGAYNKVFVLKHIEIPASCSVLVTEESEVMKQAGFIDGVNCIFADESNIAEKCANILSNERKLSEMARAGHDLIMQRHRYFFRSPIKEWLDLYKISRPDSGTGIIQPNLFDELQYSPNEGQYKFHIINRDFWEILNEFDEKMFLKKKRLTDIHEPTAFLDRYYSSYPGFLLRAGFYFLLKKRPVFSFFYFLRLINTNQKHKDPVAVSLLALSAEILGLAGIRRLLLHEFTSTSNYIYGLIEGTLNKAPASVYISESHVENSRTYGRLYDNINLNDVLCEILSNYWPGRDLVEPMMVKTPERGSQKYDKEGMFSNEEKVWKKLAKVKFGSIKIFAFKLNYLLDARLFKGKKYSNMYLY